MADIHGNPADVVQQPQLAGAGPQPVPYGGGMDQWAGNPPAYHADIGPMAPADGYVLHGVTGLNTTQDPSAHDINGGSSGLCTPYYGGEADPINAAGDNDAGGRSPLASSVAGAVANSTGRWQNLQADTYKQGPAIGTAVQGPTAAGPQQQGSVIGDLVQFPPSATDPGAGVGNTTPTGAFYDPPRGYGATGGASGAPGYTGNEPPPGYQGEAQ